MIQIKSVLLAGLCFALCQPCVHAESSLMKKGAADCYGGSIDRTIREFEDTGGVPGTSIQWLAKHYDRTEGQVVADLKRQGAPGYDDGRPPRALTDSPPIHIPRSSWNQQVYLTPEYERRLGVVIAKYNGVAFVPEASTVWLARKWNTSSDQVKYDLQRVQRHDPNEMALRRAAR